MNFLRRHFVQRSKAPDSRSLEEALDEISKGDEPTSRQPKASADRLSRFISLAALILSAAAFYYSSLRQVDDLKMFSDGRVYAIVGEHNAISAEIPDVLYFSNGGTRPIAITYIDPNITFECQDGKDSLTIGSPISLNVVSIEPGKIVAAKVSPTKFNSELQGCKLVSIKISYTVDTINAAGISQRVSVPWKLMGSLPMVAGLAFALDGPVQVFHEFGSSTKLPASPKSGQPKTQ